MEQTRFAVALVEQTDNFGTLMKASVGLPGGGA